VIFSRYGDYKPEVLIIVVNGRKILKQVRMVEIPQGSDSNSDLVRTEENTNSTY